MFVYFIQCGNRGPVKVGVAKDVDRRLADLQIANPMPLRILHKFSVRSDLEGYEIESYIHSKLRKLNYSGEWFFLIWYVDKIIECDRDTVKRIFSFGILQKHLHEAFGDNMGKREMKRKTHWH